MPRTPGDGLEAVTTGGREAAGGGGGAASSSGHASVGAFPPMTTLLEGVGGTPKVGLDAPGSDGFGALCTGTGREVPAPAAGTFLKAAMST
jgi:hypothetical protein